MDSNSTDKTMPIVVTIATPVNTAVDSPAKKMLFRNTLASLNYADFKTDAPQA
jgi:hypothetical protein